VFAVEGQEVFEEYHLEELEEQQKVLAFEVVVVELEVVEVVMFSLGVEEAVLVEKVVVAVVVVVEVVVIAEQAEVAEKLGVF
jgi:NAD(P)H-dependent flavin oxidoreductase YrpB (nitropropane dioxygenase family)